MNKIKTNGYCVIEVLDPPYTDFDKYVCVPSSWVSFQETPTEDAAVVKFPIENLSDTKKRIRKNEECSAHWNTFRINIKYTAVSYERAQQFIKSYEKGVFKKNYARNDRDEAASSSYLNKKKSTSIPSPNINKPKTFVAFSCDTRTRPAVNQTEFKRITRKNPSKKQIKVNEPGNSANTNNYLTRQARKTSQSFKMLSAAATDKSLNQNNEAQARSMEHSNDCIQLCANSKNRESSEISVSPTPRLPIEPICLKRLVDSLKKIHAGHLEFYRIVDEMRSSFRENCTLIEQMIDLIVTFNHLSNSSSVATKTVSSKGTKEKQNESFEMDTVNKTVPNIPNEQQEKKSDRRKGEDEKIYNDGCEEKMDANEDFANNSDKNETVSYNISHRTLKFTLPKEYDKNDSRWTLRHLKKKKGTVELLPDTGVYVDAIKLSNCKRISKDSKMLARMLLVEVFSANALSTCSLTGKRANVFCTNGLNIRPGLDEHAKNVLLNFVEEYAKEKQWVKTDNLFICNTLRSKLQEMRSKARKESRRLI